MPGEETVLTFLEQVPMFSDLQRADLEELASSSVLRRLHKGETLFSEGDEARGFFLLREGKVKIFKTTVDGTEHTLHLVQPGETFAEVALFAGSSYPATAQALEASKVVFFPREKFYRLVERNPQLSLNIIAGFASWVRRFNRILSEYAKSVPSRLASYLLAEALRQQSRPLSDGTCVRLEISKTEIASFLGTISATLSRAFAQLRDAGLVEVHDREVVIRDLERLRAVASGEAVGRA